MSDAKPATAEEWVEHLDLCARSHSAHLTAEQFAELRQLVKLAILLAPKPGACSSCEAECSWCKGYP
jgi:hypothetical protein